MLILCPTRELAEQVSQTLRQLARLIPNIKILNLSGGMPMKPQLDSLRHGAHIIVGTPGRVQKHLDKNTLSLNHLKTLVLDEADRMLDMGFLESIQEIISACSKDRQTLLFSATYSDDIKKISKQFMRHPQEIKIESVHTELDIEQCFYELKNQEDKFQVLKKLLLQHKPSAALIFCNTKQQTKKLANQLKQSGFSALSINGDMEQGDRDEAIIRFTNQSCSILVATDVAARGLDIKELPAVINYDLAFESDVHIHRIGRTGRAGHKGLAISLTTPADAERIIAIEDKLPHQIKWKNSNEIVITNESILLPAMITIRCDMGKKDKIRPGDILGALIKDAGLPKDSIGKINITTFNFFVAINRDYADKAYRYLQNGKLKGRKVNVK